MRYRAGIGMVESVISIGICTVLFVIIFSVFPIAFKSAEKGERIAVASILARQILEEAKGGNFLNLASMDLPDITANNVIFKRRLEVLSYESYDLSVIKSLRAIVTWEKDGLSTLETLYYNQY